MSLKPLAAGLVGLSCMSEPIPVVIVIRVQLKNIKKSHTMGE